MSRTIIASAITPCAHLAATSERETLVQIATPAPDKSQYTLSTRHRLNYSLPCGFTLFGQTRIDILDQPGTSNMRAQWQNPIGLSRTIIGNLSGYVEFYNAVSTG